LARLLTPPNAGSIHQFVLGLLVQVEDLVIGHTVSQHWGNELSLIYYSPTTLQESTLLEDVAYGVDLGLQIELLTQILKVCKALFTLWYKLLSEAKMVKHIFAN
jgi:hypothetical protein